MVWHCSSMAVWERINAGQWQFITCGSPKQPYLDRALPCVLSHKTTQHHVEGSTASEPFQIIPPVAVLQCNSKVADQLPLHHRRICKGSFGKEGKGRFYFELLTIPTNFSVHARFAVLLLGWRP